MNKEYETVIGLEVHVELATKTKIFCGCSTAFGGAPNTHTCPVCAGMPGALPVLNKRVLKLAIAVGLATGCSIRRYIKFDRKNYFYPDNPQNYQISQLYFPICHDGRIEITDEKGSRKYVGIHEIHMEEDAGKLIHDAQEDTTLVDYNRSGVPLIEIVSECDMRSSFEVIGYLEKLRTIIQYLGASDCKLQEGSMRADVNISVREKGSKELGTRTEMKNLNSFSSITHAIEGESRRQISIIESGNSVVQETRRWDDAKGESYTMRSKEDAKDYRYFPDPDLVPIVIPQEMIDGIKAAEPELREKKIQRFRLEYDIPDYDIDIITSSRELAVIFEEACALGANPKKASNWIMGETMRMLKENNMDPKDIRFSAENLARLIAMTEDRLLSSTNAKVVFAAMFRENVNPEDYAKQNSLLAVNDTDALRRVICDVIDKNPKAVQDYRAGKERALGALVGQTMKMMKGQADPGDINRLLREML